MKDEYGWSALMISSAAGHTDIVGFLLASGADMDTTDKSGRKAIDIAQLKSMSLHFW